MDEYSSEEDERTCPHFELFIQWELDGDVSDAEETGQQSTVECADALCAVDGEGGIKCVSISHFTSGLCLMVVRAFHQHARSC